MRHNPVHAKYYLILALHYNTRTEPYVIALGIYTELSSVLLINTNGEWFDWFVSLQACKLSLCFSPSLCYQTECSAKQLMAVDLSYCWLYLSKQAVDHFMLFARLDRVLFSRLECSVEQGPTANLCLCCWRWQIIDCEEYI